MDKAKEIEEKARSIIANQLKIDGKDITNNSLLVDDLGADSLDILELVVEFEQELDINIPDEILTDFRTFENIVNGLKKVLLKSL